MAEDVSYKADLISMKTDLGGTISYKTHPLILPRKTSLLVIITVDFVEEEKTSKNGAFQ